MNRNRLPFQKDLTGIIAARPNNRLEKFTPPVSQQAGNSQHLAGPNRKGNIAKARLIG